MRAKISFPCAFLISACVAAGLGIAVRAIAAAEDESGPEMLEFRAQLEIVSRAPRAFRVSLVFLDKQEIRA